MDDTVRQNIDSLIKLQEAETEIVRLNDILEKVEKQKLDLEKQLKEFGQAFEEEKEKLERQKSECEDLQAEIQVIDARIIKSNETLRMVRTNKEYQLLLREVDDNKNRKDAFETQLLEHLDVKEMLQEKVDELEKEYTLLRDRITEEQSAIEKKSSDDRELLEEFYEKQKSVGETLSSSTMTMFKKISKMNRGLAVVNVKNEVCMGCFMNIPPQLYIEVMRCNSVISCPQCSRILYFKEDQDSV